MEAPTTQPGESFRLKREKIVSILERASGGATALWPCATVTANKTRRKDLAGIRPRYQSDLLVRVAGGREAFAVAHQVLGAGRDVGTKGARVGRFEHHLVVVANADGDLLPARAHEGDRAIGN